MNNSFDNLSEDNMRRTHVTVPWAQGLHTRPASKLIHLAKQYRSSIQLRAHGKVADARSLINILLLCATFGTLLEVVVSGEDEAHAVTAIEQLFAPDGDAEPSDTEPS